MENSFCPFSFLYKDSARRAQYRTKNMLLSQGIAEPPYTLYKDTPTYKPKIEQLGLTGLP